MTNGNENTAIAYRAMDLHEGRWFPTGQGWREVFNFAADLNDGPGSEGNNLYLDLADFAARSDATTPFDADEFRANYDDYDHLNFPR